MLRFILWRLASAVPTLFVVVTLSFFLIRFAPGGPFNLERPLPAQIMANLQAVYHLDEPIWRQYLTYLANLAVGDFGPSYIYRDFTILQLMGQSLPYSLVLGSLALLLALFGGVALGVAAALRQNGIVDVATMTFANIGTTVPSFVLGPVLIYIFAVTLHWLPAGSWGDGSAKFLLLPMIGLALPELAVFARLSRGAMLEALNTDHIRTMRACGLPASSVVVHALRAALLPVVTYLAPATASLLTGSVVIETIFGIPGVGRYFVQGALNRDYTLVMATVVLIAVFIVTFNLVADIFYALLDPRVRYD
jgi:oligopeptide transport system permease protein